MTGLTNWAALRGQNMSAPLDQSFTFDNWTSGPANWAPDAKSMGALPVDVGALATMPAAVAGPTNWWDSFKNIDWLNKVDPKTGLMNQGVLGAGLGVANGLMNAYLGFQNLGVAKDTLAQNKRQFDLNFGAQQKTINARLEDQARARVAANPGAYMPVDTYMKKYGV